MKARELIMEMMSMATAARNLAAFNDEQAPLLDGAKAVAGKAAEFDLKLVKVEERSLPPVDADFARAFGVFGASIHATDLQMAVFSSTAPAGFCTSRCFEPACADELATSPPTGAGSGCPFPARLVLKFS